MYTSSKFCFWKNNCTYSSMDFFEMMIVLFLTTLLGKKPTLGSEVVRKEPSSLQVYRSNWEISGFIAYLSQESLEAPRRMTSILTNQETIAIHYDQYLRGYYLTPSSSHMYATSHVTEVQKHQTCQRTALTSFEDSQNNRVYWQQLQQE